jgi:hypothetical protein
MLPTATDLDDPDGFVHREQLDFSELDKMLGEAAGGSKDGPKPDLGKDRPSGDSGTKGTSGTGGPSGTDEDKGEGDTDK